MAESSSAFQNHQALNVFSKLFLHELGGLSEAMSLTKTHSCLQLILC